MDRIFRIDYHGEPRYAIERDQALYLLEGDPFDAFAPGEQIVGAGVAPEARRSFRVLVPVVPSKIVAVGLNYKDHAAERNKPLPTQPYIFVKPSSAVIGPGDPIVIPRGVGRVDHEAEMGVVIRRRASRVPRERAMDYVLGFTCVNDVTARELQDRGIQYSHCKGYDTFAPIGPAVAVGLDGGALDVEGWVNGDRRQASNTRQLVFPVAELVAFISAIMTLVPGDVIATGTPSGIGPLTAGDQVRVKVTGVGELVNPVQNQE